MDINKLASKITKEATHEKNSHAQALGRLGGLKGGPASKAKLTSEEKKKIAKKAVKARWKK